MGTKEMVMARMGVSKIGKKTQFKDIEKGKDIHINVGEEVIMEVSRLSEETNFVIGRYDEKEKLYRVVYDPNPSGGRILSIVSIYA